MVRIMLSFTIDPSTDITTYSLEKKTGIPEFREINRFTSVSASLIYSDNNADINSINYYRLSAMNSCNIPVTVSNLSFQYCSVTFIRMTEDLVLNWNPYREWLGVFHVQDIC